MEFMLKKLGFASRRLLPVNSCIINKSNKKNYNKNYNNSNDTSNSSNSSSSSSSSSRTSSSNCSSNSGGGVSSHSNHLSVPTADVVTASREFVATTPTEGSHVQVATTVARTAAPRLGDFVFKTVVGAGSYGQVLLVRRIKTNRHYAAKMVRKRHCSEPAVLTELSVLIRVRELPFLMKLHCSFQTRDRIFFVMDFVNGGNLFQNLLKQEDRRFPRPLVVFYSAEISCALHSLHKLGIIHQDVKPQNILLDREGHIVLTDFGLSLEGAGYNPRASHARGGTPHYTAPEVLAGDGGHGFPVDWWALGVIIYEMLTGDLALKKEKKEEVNMEHQQFGGQVPEGVSEVDLNIINGLLDRNPELRLGADYETFKREQFFSEIDWDLLQLKKVRPPHVPDVPSDSDTSCFKVPLKHRQFRLYSRHDSRYIIDDRSRIISNQPSAVHHISKSSNVNLRSSLFDADKRLYDYVSPEWETLV